MESIIYRDLEKELAKSCGYFETKSAFNKIADHKWKAGHIDSATQVIYYPGSFGTFHDGHASVCLAAKKKYPNSVLVISPANSDYAVDKYGSWSEFSSNKLRYEAIKRACPDAVIDIDPMLSFDCDHNFTDLLENFLKIHGLSIDKMQRVPIILTGKDKEFFAGLNGVTSRVRIEHFEDITGKSTSKLHNFNRKRKKLLLRCDFEEQLDIFSSFFTDQYTDIIPVFVADEVNLAINLARKTAATHTICKEYAHFLPYIKVSRTFVNPLEDSTFPEGYNPGIEPGMKILDSDVYSGSTKRFIESKGAEFVTVMDLERHTNEIELLDINDFFNPKFAYPWVDISSRCSMQAFDHDFHKRYAAFREKLCP